MKNIKQKVSDLRKSFDDFVDALPDADYFDCLTDGHDWENVLSELYNVSNQIHKLEKIKDSEITSAAFDILNNRPYGSENIKGWDEIDMTYCDSSQFDGDGLQIEYYEEERTGRTFSLQISLDDARQFGTWEETTQYKPEDE